MKSDHLHWRTSSDIHQSWISNEFHWWGLLWDQKTSRGCLPITRASTSSTQTSAEWCLSKKPSFRRSINIFSMKEIFNIMIYVPLKIMKVCEYCHILWDSIAIQATRSDIEIFPSPHPMASHDGAFRPWERRVAGVSGVVSSSQGPVSCQWIGSVMGFLPKKRLYIWWQKPWFIMVSCWFFHEFSGKKQSVDLGSKEKRGTKRDRTGFSHQWVYHKGQRVSTVIVFPVGVKGFHHVQQVLPKR